MSVEFLNGATLELLVVSGLVGEVGLKGNEELFKIELIDFSFDTVFNISCALRKTLSTSSIFAKFDDDILSIKKYFKNIYNAKRSQ